MKFVYIAIAVVAYLCIMFLLGIAGPGANIETGQNSTPWYKVAFWPLWPLMAILGL